MGIIDRIAGTLDELAGDGDGAREEIALAAALIERGDLEDAEARLRAVAARYPSSARPSFTSGGRALRGDLEGAVTAFGKVVDLDRQIPEAWGGARRRARAARAHGAGARRPPPRARARAFGRAAAAARTRRLGRVHADAGQLGKAVRDLHKALSSCWATTPRCHWRTGARSRGSAREPEADEWLTRSAAAPGARRRRSSGRRRRRPRTRRSTSARRCCAEEGSGARRARPSCRQALARQLARAGRADDALTLALAETSPRTRAGGTRWPRSASPTRRRRAGARRLPSHGARPKIGAAPDAPTRLALALAAHDRDALVALAAEDASNEATALRAFLAGTASDDELVALARSAPDEVARRFVVAGGAPVPQPGASLVGLLGWAHAFASRTPALVALAPAAGRALEAFDRPLLVAVMGEFNAGKSSFVNALVGEEVAPTGVTPTTATVQRRPATATPPARASCTTTARRASSAPRS